MVHGKPGSVMGLRHLLIRPRRCTMPDHDRPPTVAVVTLGCGRNEVDSENVAGLLSASGFRMVADPERADAVVVNTCAFIQAAKRESIDTILAAADLKEQGRASAVFVTGCLAERYTRELRQELPEADAIVPFADYSRLPELLRSRLPNGSALGPKAGAATALASPRRHRCAWRRQSRARRRAARPWRATRSTRESRPPARLAWRRLGSAGPGWAPGASAGVPRAGRGAL